MSIPPSRKGQLHASTPAEDAGPASQTALHAAIARLERSDAIQDLSDEDVAALQPCDDVGEHWAQVQAALVRKRSSHKSMGDDVKPLSALACDAADMWMYLQLAKRVAALRALESVPVVGICAPTGAGKSTLVQLLRMLLEDVLEIGQVRLPHAHAPRLGIGSLAELLLVCSTRAALPSMAGGRGVSRRLPLVAKGAEAARHPNSLGRAQY